MDAPPGLRELCLLPASRHGRALISAASRSWDFFRWFKVHFADHLHYRFLGFDNLEELRGVPLFVSAVC